MPFSSCKIFTIFFKHQRLSLGKTEALVYDTTSIVLLSMVCFTYYLLSIEIHVFMCTSFFQFWCTPSYLNYLWITGSWGVFFKLMNYMCKYQPKNALVCSRKNCFLMMNRNMFEKNWNMTILFIILWTWNLDLSWYEK